MGKDQRKRAAQTEGPALHANRIDLRAGREPAVVQVVILRDGLLIGTEVFMPGSYAVGSSDMADLRLDDPSIEPIHAFLYFHNLRAVIRSAHGPGGVYVNGHRIRTCEVRSIDEVCCGPYLLKIRVVTRHSPLPGRRTSKCS
jgi:hypothetical protein